MKAKREYRNRSGVEVEVLDALVDRNTDGMTVFELRSHVETDIDDLEDALSKLKDDGLIHVENEGSRTLIIPADRVVPDENEPPEQETVLDRIRKRLPF